MIAADVARGQRPWGLKTIISMARWAMPMVISMIISTVRRPRFEMTGYAASR